MTAPPVTSRMMVAMTAKATTGSRQVEWSAAEARRVMLRIAAVVRRPGVAPSGSGTVRDGIL